MMEQIARTAVVALFFAWAVSCAHAGDSLVPQPGPQLLVLRNGEIFEGRITLVGDTYLVDRPGAQIRMAQSNVEMVCNTLEEAYARKRATIQVGNVQHHLELAQWCLRNKLNGQAAVELADATVVDPRNPKIEALQHRLKLAIEPPRVATEKKPAQTGPTTEELDRMVRGLPRGVVETFTQSVQPVLLNNCANGGCHGPQSTGTLRLFPLSSNKASSRRVTQRNLYGVLQFVDASNPGASALLKAASGPHGTVRYPIFNERQASQYQRLADWAVAIARPTGPETPDAVAAPAALAESWPGAPAVLSAQESRNARQLKVADPRYGDRRVSHRPSGAKAKPGEVAPASYESAGDPLDPEAFNRRHAATVPNRTAPQKKQKQEEGSP